jgi:hypothetical protein
MFGLDWAWGHISAAALSAVHADFAARYLSRDEGKNLQLKEARDLTSGKKFIIVVWETTASRAAQGFNAGVADARAAKAQAASRGKPDWRPIFFAVDFPGSAAQVAPYFRGVNSVLGKSLTGAYGSYAVIKGLFDMGLIAFGWQTYAWSGGLWDPRAHVQQYSNDHHVAGVSCDFDRANAADFGQWQVGQKKPAPPRDVLWFMHDDERMWVRRFNWIAHIHTQAAHTERMALAKRINDRRKLIWKRSQGHGGKDWNIWHRRERFHTLSVVVRQPDNRAPAAVKRAA